MSTAIDDRPKKVEGCCPDPAALMEGFAAIPSAAAVLTANGNLVHQAIGGQPRQIYEGFSQRFLESDEQPYERHLRVGEAAQGIDCGWVEKPSLIVVVNEPARFQRVPTAEAKAEADARVVEVGLLLDSGDFWPVALVRPGRKHEFEPALNKGSYLLRCRQGEARCTVWAIPQ